MRATIVASQVAVTCVLVIGAVLLSRSFIAHVNADRGYDPANLLTAAIPFPQTYAPRAVSAALRRILDRVKTRPGVTHAAISTALPLVSSGGFLSFKFPSSLGAGGKWTSKRFGASCRPSISARLASACGLDGR